MAGGTPASRPTGLIGLVRRLERLEARMNAQRGSNGAESTVIDSGGITLTGTASVSSESEDGPATRLAAGAAEVRATPESEWVPLEQQILEQVPELSDGNPPTGVPEFTLSGGVGAMWVKTEPMENPDLLSFDAYARIGGAGSFFRSAVIPNGGSGAIRTIDGVDLNSGDVVEVYLIAREEIDGEGPASEPKTATVKAVDFGDVSADLREKVFGSIGDYVVEYAVSASETVAPTTGWSSATPSRVPGQFIWIRTRVTYQDDSEVLTSPALLTGNSGAPGIQGVPGTNGTDGSPRYTWIKYGDTPTTGMSDNPAGKAYLGLAYNKTTATESTNYADYDWSLVKGTDGTSGSDGTPGAAGKGISSTAVTYQVGTSGTTAPSGTWQATVQTTSVGQFLWVRTITTYTDATTVTAYAVSAHGATGTAGSAGAPGRGISGTTVTYQVGVSGTVAPAGTWQSGPQSTSPGQFHWTRTVTSYTDASAPSTAYAVAAHGNTGQQGVPGSPGADGSPTYTWVKYGTSITGAGISDDPTGRDYIGLAYNKATPTESTTPGDYQWSLFKGSDGADGAAGAPGVGITGTTVTYQVGTSGTTAPTGTWLASPAATSPGQFLWTRTVTSYTSGSPTTAYAVSAHGATGTAGSPGTNGAPGAAGKGISSTAVSYQVTTSGTTAPTGTWQAGPQVTTAGQFQWTRTITTYTDATTTTAYAVSAHGATGATGNTGATGVSISTVTPYFQTTASAASAPAVPTTTTPPAPWTTTEPAYTVGTALWRTERIGYSNGTFAYTTVTKVSAFTAASLALTTANGKNTNTSGTVPSPTTTGRVPGDLHYVTGTGDKAGSYVRIQQLSPGPSFAWVDMPADVATLAGANVGWLNAIIASVDTLLARLVAADEVTADMVSSDIIVANDFYTPNGVTIAGDSGANLSMTDGAGIVGTNPAGEVTTRIDHNTGLLYAVGATFKGLVEATSAVLSKFTLRGAGRLDPGSSMMVSSGVSAPTQPPTAARSYGERVAFTIFANSNYGLVRNVENTGWVYGVAFFGGDIREILDTGATGRTSSVSDEFWNCEGGVTRIGSNYYGLGIHKGYGVPPSLDGKWFIKRFNSSFVETGNWSADVASGYARRPALGTNGTDLLIARTLVAGGAANIVVNRHSATTGAYIAQPVGTTAGFTGMSDISSVNVSDGRYVVTGGRSLRAYTSAGARDAAYEWLLAGTASVRGMGTDATRFAHLDDSGKLFTYSTLAAPAVRTIQNSDYDSTTAGTGTHETDRGPVLTYTQVARSYLTINTTTPNNTGETDSPDSVRIWINGQRQPDLGVGVTTATYEIPATGTTTKAPSFATAGTAVAVIGSEAAGWAGYGDGRLLTRSPQGPTEATPKSYVDGGAEVSYISIWRDGNQAVGNNAWGRIPFNASAGSRGLTSSGGLITVTESGLYDVKLAAHFAANANGYRGLRVLHNGVSVMVDYKVPDNGSNSVTASAAKLLQLAAGDTLDMQAIQNSGGTLNIFGGAQQDTWTTLFKVGAA